MKLSEKQKRRYSALSKYLPAMLFALYAFLLFLFYFAPVASIQISFGVATPLKTSYNVYQIPGNESFNAFTGSISTLSSSMNALIIFAVLALICSIVGLIFLETPFFSFTERIPENTLKWIRLVFRFLPCFFYFLFFVITCVIYAKIGIIDSDSGLSALNGKNGIFVGACPTLILTFTILFALVHFAALLYEFVLKKRM